MSFRDGIGYLLSRISQRGLSFLIRKGFENLSHLGCGFPNVLKHSRVDLVLDLNSNVAVLVSQTTALAVEIVSG